MGGLDWILIAIYLLIMLGIGFTSMKKVKTNEDYALAGRSVGNFWVILSCLLHGQVFPVCSEPLSMYTSMASPAGGGG